jgi:lysophospholipid acyltransferase
MFRTESWKVDDPTTIYMMSICKFSSLAFSYEDGMKKDEEIINSHHREYRVYEMPSLLEVLSFIYFYPTSIIGPSLEYKDFNNFMLETDCYSRLGENINYILTQGTLYFFVSFACMAFYAVLAQKLPVAKVVEEDFGQHNLFYVLAYIYFCIPGVRAKYYSGWLLSYSTVIFSGIAYTEKKDDKNEGKIIKSMDKGSYGSIVTCEWAINPKQSMTDWNYTIHLWLKYNVYTRTININKKPFKNNWAMASFLTFISSAVWHGFYLTYYLTFGLLFFYQSSADVFDKIGVYKWINKTKFLMPLGSILNGLAFETIGIFFFNLYWKEAMIGARNMRYFPIIYIMGLFVISKMIKVPKKEKKERKSETKEVNKKVE